jgi:hypothetical protein
MTNSLNAFAQTQTLTQSIILLNNFAGSSSAGMEKIIKLMENG